ncbi:MAG: AtpZ/AtpI family protein [Acidimicrobiia bacterium]
MKIIPDVSKFVEKSKQRNAEPKSSMHALELVITVLIFLGIGRLLDSKFDTTPWLTITFTILSAAGSFATAYYRYITTSKVIDEGKAWAKNNERTQLPEYVEEDDSIEVPKGYGND